MPDLGTFLHRLADLRAILDILVVTVIIYWMLWVAQGTRATQLIRGIIILLAIFFFLANSLDLQTLNWLLERTWPVLIVAVPIIFQPELRRALEQLGHTETWLRTPFPSGNEEDMERTVDEVVRAAAQLARQRFGALMIIERETGLQDFAVRGVSLDAALTRQLLINIFFPNSPLHDAAVVIRGDRIVAAQRRLAPDRQHLRYRSTRDPPSGGDRDHRGVGRACRGRLRGDRTDCGSAQRPPDSQPGPGPVAPGTSLAAPSRPPRRAPQPARLRLAASWR